LGDDFPGKFRKTQQFFHSFSGFQYTTLRDFPFSDHHRVIRFPSEQVSSGVDARYDLAIAVKNKLLRTPLPYLLN
jgi:hypothetical protein